MTTRRTAARIAAAATASSLVLLTGTPAVAADAPVAQASATALRLTIAGTPADSGTFTVTHDGERQRSEGSDSPALSVLGGQDFVQAGTLAQKARTRVEDGRGASAACSGLAGDGAVLLEVDEGSCLRPGDNLELTAGNLDLSNLQILRSDFLAGFDQQLQDALAPVLDPLLAGLQAVLEQVLDAADAALVLDLGAVQSFCVARPGEVSGGSTLAGAGASLRLAGQEVTLLDLPADPAPNTKLVTDLGEVVDLVLQTLRTQFTEAIEGVLGPLGQVIDQAEVLTAALGTVGEQLAPLEENVLDVTLNKQQRGKNRIDVTALDVRVLPVAASFGVELLDVEIGHSSCGPNGRVQPDEPQEPNTPAPQPQPQPEPQVPISVPAGSAGSSGSGLGTGGLLVLLLTALGAGAVATRRTLRS
ncbi:hypothetical protein GGQ22_17815 [Nocardioides sp. zg-579]|uniref:Choice-of-anchor G family protein n=1 Tax=Nocardioides marmotae TaxID=2663857 RepID=A0A6I3JF91_9ACTN|nr:hypothetical protein [Nocardioides marmotae]MCR6033279.1 hypothetical protein [Gordonia jinghuaiqii]MTB96936.1 hypothetical protein [Nocardioides marmotae]QKE00679.1 hypothetical protein HPC71_05990 [Nocardioides marmotae]